MSSLDLWASLKYLIWGEANYIFCLISLDFNFGKLYHFPKLHHFWQGLYFSVIKVSIRICVHTFDFNYMTKALTVCVLRDALGSVS